MISVRDLFLDFQECRGGRNSEERPVLRLPRSRGGRSSEGGVGGGRWLTSAASHYYVLYPLRKSKSSGLPNQGLTSTARFYSHYRPTGWALSTYDPTQEMWDLGRLRCATLAKSGCMAVF